MLTNESEYQKMAAVESEHWWYQSLHLRVAQTLQSRFGDDKNIRIIDAGCGTCGLLKFLKKKGYSNLAGMDISPFAIHNSAADFELIQDDIRQIQKHFSVNSADVILSNDVLYFFDQPEWQRLTNSFYDVLKPNGILILNLPAFPCFRGIHDLSVGIKHRFQKKDIQFIFNNDKFDLKLYSFWPFYLSPLILAERIKQQLLLLFLKTPTITSDANIPGPFLNKFFLNITKSEISKKFSFGSSLYIIAEKKISMSITIV